LFREENEGLGPLPSHIESSNSILIRTLAGFAAPSTAEGIEAVLTAEAKGITDNLLSLLPGSEVFAGKRNRSENCRR
jgi:hypothetical protein